MAKIQIKSEKLTPFGGIFSIMEKFDSMLSPVIDSTLGQRCSSIFGYQFSEIVRSLMSVYCKTLIKEASCNVTMRSIQARSLQRSPALEQPISWLKLVNLSRQKGIALKSGTPTVQFQPKSVSLRSTLTQISWQNLIQISVIKKV